MSDELGIDYFLNYFNEKLGNVVIPLQVNEEQMKAYQTLMYSSAVQQQFSLIRYGYTVIAAEQLEALQNNGMKLSSPSPCNEDHRCLFGSGPCSADICPSMKEGFIPGHTGDAHFPFGCGVYLNQHPPKNADGKCVLCCVFLTEGLVFVDNMEEFVEDSTLDVLFQNQLWIIRNSSGVFPVGYVPFELITENYLANSM